MFREFRGAVQAGRLGLVLVLGLLAAEPAAAQAGDQPSGKIDWGLWVDGDGCMHWYADGGFEGYMVPRRNPHTGRPVCLKRHACLAQSSDELFDGDALTKDGAAMLQAFFAEQEAEAYAIYAHSDGAGGKAQAERLTQAQAAAVAALAKASGEHVTSAVGGGARYPKVSNASAAGKATNRRIEVVCYR
jgi:outer membrane protein OmpA-like peptidoglycan-associated protein